MVVCKARAVLSDGNSTCKRPEVGPSFVSWRKDEMAQVVESERGQWRSSEYTFSFLLLSGSHPYSLSSQIATVDLSFPLCPSPSSATEVLRLITSLPYFENIGCPQNEAQTLQRNSQRSSCPYGPTS